MLPVIFLIILLILLAGLRRVSSAQTGGTVMGPFKTLSENEMDGVPGSWSGKPTASGAGTRPILVADKNPITYYGHGIPLRPVEPGPMDRDPLMLPHNTDLAVRPECCPSPYSTDRGCLCGAIEDIKKLTSRH
jgi:hypothetical protein